VNTASITVAIPTIPPRTKSGGLLDQAVSSVQQQTLQPTGGISCSLDVLKQGAGVTRQRALDGVHTDWVAFLDDDDMWYPHHLDTLYSLVCNNDGDVAYSWFDGNNPFPQHRGRQMNPDDPHHTTMTLLVRTEIAKQVGFTNYHPDGWVLPQEDWQFILGCLSLGAKFVGTGDITWHYRRHAGNTSGIPTRW
jgi:glycosyltransferase involved in cell wall biosynthesis